MHSENIGFAKCYCGGIEDDKIVVANGMHHCYYLYRMPSSKTVNESNMREWTETVNMCTGSERTLLFHGASAHRAIVKEVSIRGRP